jgi:hypothetical protein
MRDERVKQGRTQQQEAEWLGISPMELNDIERGRRSMDEVKKPVIEEMESSRGRGANREVKKMSLNRVSLIGHLGQDPELRYLPTSGQPVTGFSIATDESFTGKDGNRQERVEWHHIVVFGNSLRPVQSISAKADRFMLKADCRCGNLRARTAAASGSVRRS